MKNLKITHYLETTNKLNFKRARWWQGSVDDKNPILTDPQSDKSSVITKSYNTIRLQFNRFGHWQVHLAKYAKDKIVPILDNRNDQNQTNESNVVIIKKGNQVMLSDGSTFVTQGNIYPIYQQAK